MRAPSTNLPSTVSSRSDYNNMRALSTNPPPAVSSRSYYGDTRAPSTNLPSAASYDIRSYERPSGTAHLGVLYKTSSRDVWGGSDWCLISIQDERCNKSNAIAIPGLDDLEVAWGGGVTITQVASDESRDVEVFAVTSSRGVIRGTLSGTPYYCGMTKNKSFQKYWTAHLEHSVGK